jgi:3-dehydroquinate synthase
MSSGGPQRPTDRTVRVEVPGQPYEVRIGSGLLSQLGEFLNSLGLARPGSHAFIAYDSRLPDATVAAARQSVESAGLRVSSAFVVADEASKSISALEALLVRLAQSRHERREPLIALGGGIVGDLAGFAAAIYRRGVPVIQCPTTLLSMVDASVGGKTGINFAIGPGESDFLKNLIGAFHQPALVLADVSTVASLPDRQFRSGIAECIKHGLLSADFGDPDLLGWTTSHMETIVARDAATLIELIHRNVAVKAAVVKGDERELSPAGGRALLNLGHSFGHAIETLPGLDLLHGEAVALGLMAATTCSAAMNRCPKALPDEVKAVLTKAGLPTQLQGLPPDDQLLARMAHDKKVEGGSLRLILPLGTGRSMVVRDPSAAQIQVGWAAIRA